MGKQSSSPEPTLVLAKKQPGTWQEEVLLRLVCPAACLHLILYLFLAQLMCPCPVFSLFPFIFTNFEILHIPPFPLELSRLMPWWFRAIKPDL